MTTPVGRRERKKAATRRALADAALTLFRRHGYDAVTLHDVAEAADVSTTTLLKYFPGKEALVFDEETDQEAGLVAAVQERASGTTVPQALCAYVKHVRVHPTDTDTDTGPGPGPGSGSGSGSGSGTSYADFHDLVTRTPALSEYGHRMWMRHQDALARAIAQDAGAPPDDPRSTALARFALETSALAHRAANPEQAVDVAFDLLEHGWSTPPRPTSTDRRRGA
ncbi:TetR/AcrR family transcriptional regulator [Streptomyces sp. NPDC021093]|uniref:TetR/AcrR family transcriptional regulator n=1 Tax=Streptomyces sp. NPDC021093 TaxID=3365112 RepID=UPI0037AA7255